MTGRQGRGAGTDAGVALVTVMIAIMVISLFLLISLGYGLQNTPAARRDQDAKIASAAAQAGLEDYISRLNGTPGYQDRANNDPANPAFTSSQVIQGTGTAGASYSYRVLSSAADLAATGLLRLRVTGISGPDTARAVSRTLTVNLREKAFLNSIYFSDYEVQDPDLVGTNSSCAKYYYQGRNNMSGCNEIQWGGNDVVDGPLHSNDALWITGAVKFKNSAETSCPPTLLTGNTYKCASPKTWWGTAAAGSLAGNNPHYAAPVGLPDSNSSLMTATTPGSSGLSTGPGCYYTGATKITFTGSTMSVLSPATTSPQTPSTCLNVGNRANEQANLPIPPVIYVDPTTASCSSVGYPATNEAIAGSGNSADAYYWTSTSSRKTTNYRCGRGTVFISGSVHKQVTIGAANDIVVTGNLTVADNMTGSDVIGLVTNNYIWVYHPIKSDSSNLLASSATVTKIQAAVLSLQHSFVVQNWNAGALVGTLNVTGAIAQKFRGPVGTSGSPGTGYSKSYVYDARLAYLQPPYFVSGDGQWMVSSITDN